MRNVIIHPSLDNIDFANIISADRVNNWSLLAQRKGPTHRK